MSFSVSKNTLYQGMCLSRSLLLNRDLFFPLQWCHFHGAHNLMTNSFGQRRWYSITDLQYIKSGDKTFGVCVCVCVCVRAIARMAENCDMLK